MRYQTIQVTPCTPLIGAEIRGVDLTQPLPDAQWNEVRDAFLQHSAIFFRDQQPLTPEQQIAFGRRFGTLHIHPAAPHVPGDASRDFGLAGCTRHERWIDGIDRDELTQERDARIHGHRQACIMP